LSVNEIIVLSKIFRHFDTNNDGTLSIEQVNELLKTLSTETKEDETKQIES